MTKTGRNERLEQEAYDRWVFTPWPDGSNAAREALSGAPAGARTEQAWREGFRAGLAANETPVREELASPELNLRVDTTWATHDDLQTLRKLLEASIAELRGDWKTTDDALGELERKVEDAESGRAGRLHERIDALEKMHEGQPEKTSRWEQQIEERLNKLEKLTEDPGQFPDGTKYGALSSRVARLEVSHSNNWHEHQRLIEDAQKRADHHGMTLASHKSKLDHDYKAIEELKGRVAAAHGVLPNHAERLLRIENALGALGKLGA